MSALVAPASSAAPSASQRSLGALGVRGGQPQAQPGQRGDAERKVDEEDPAPAHVLDQHAADQRADDGRDREGGRDVALVAPALARRDEITDGGHRQRHEAARGDALSEPQHDELCDVLCGGAERRGEDEADERDLEQALAAMSVAELAPQRRRRGGRDDVGRDDPRDVAEAAELAGDRRQRRREDRLIEHRRQHRQDDRRERDEDGARGASIGSG